LDPADEEARRRHAGIRLASRIDASLAPHTSNATEVAVTFRKPSRTIRVEPIQRPVEQDRPQRAEPSAHKDRDEPRQNSPTHSPIQRETPKPARR
jgi:hypothetical protein